MKTAQEIIDAYDRGSLYLGGCDLTGITLPTSIGGSLDLRGCDLTGITLPTSIGGSLDLGGCDLTGITLPTSIGGWLDLGGCDLTGITLPTSIGGSLYLRGCDLTGITLPTSIGGSLNLHKKPWDVSIDKERMTIGCKSFSHVEWVEFSDSEISEMEQRALAFWKENNPELMRLCAHMAQ
jgi:hypothetical protein